MEPHPWKHKAGVFGWITIAERRLDQGENRKRKRIGGRRGDASYSPGPGKLLSITWQETLIHQSRCSKHSFDNSLVEAQTTLCFHQNNLVYAEVLLWISRKLKHLSLANNLRQEIQSISVNTVLRHGYSEKVFEVLLTQQEKREHLLWFAG